MLSDLIKNTLLYSIIALAAAGSVLVMLSTIFGLIFRFFIKVMEIDPNVLIQQQQLIEVASHVIALGIYFIVYKLIFRKDNKIQDEGVKVKKMGLCAMMGIGVSGISLLWIMLSHHIPMLQESGSMLEQSSKNMALGNPILVILLKMVARDDTDDDPKVTLTSPSLPDSPHRHARPRRGS